MVFNREEWLNKAAEMMAPDFSGANLTLPEKIYISVGLTQTRCSPTSSGSVGVTWHNASDEGIYHVFISPVLSESIEVLGVLRHELIHCCFDAGVGHRKPFGDACKKLGLVRPWTATSVSEELEEEFKEKYIPVLGEYSQPLFDNTTSAKPGSRLLKASCRCGYVVRITRKWADQALPDCPLCDNVKLKLDTKL